MAEQQEQKQEKQAESRYGNVKRYRHEYKYRIDARQESILQVKAMGVLRRDPHVGKDGTYLVRSAYFDDLNDTCLMENLSGTDPRSKFRIRYYNSDIGHIRLEKKSKRQGMCLKESCSLTIDECILFLKGLVPTVTPDMPEEKQRLITEIQLRNLHPRVIVTYERVPFIYEGGNVRVTFDRNITSSENVKRFLHGDYVRRPVLPAGCSILEVKWDELFPRHIREVMQLENLNWTAFSKYSMCRMYHL